MSVAGKNSEISLFLLFWPAKKDYPPKLKTRSLKMGKKRKANDRPFGQSEDSRSRDGESSKLRINTYEDVADSNDEFQINRDKILLEESPAQKSQRKALEEGTYELYASVAPSAADWICRGIFRAI